MRTLGGLTSSALRGNRRLRIAACLITAATLAAPAAASATDFAPTTTADGNNGACTPALCTLRDALTAAGLAPGNSVSIPAGNYTVSMGELPVTNAMTVTGAGARTTTVDAGGTSRVFRVSGDFEATIRDLTVTGGNASATSSTPAGDGGGILNLATTLHLARIALVGNTATFGGGGLIAPFESAPAGPVTTIDASLISGNTVTGGVVDGQGGGLALFGNATITNSTIAGNRVSNPGLNQGGGIVAAKDATATDPATLTLLNSTVAGNTIAGMTPSGLTPNFGGGIAGTSLGVTPVLTDLVAQNSIVAGNVVDGAVQDCGLVSAATSDHNLSSDASCMFTDPGSLQNTDPRLGNIQDNSGPTNTMALLDKSPAINAGDNSGCPAADQRGTSRPQGPACDIGAYERVLVTDLALTQRPAKARVKPGKAAKFLLTVSNRGELTAPGVTLTDRLPAKVFKAKTSSSCAIARPKKKHKKAGHRAKRRRLRSASCSLGDIAPGSSITLRLKVRSRKRKGALTNNAAVAAQIANSSPATSASATVRIRRPKKH